MLGEAPGFILTGRAPIVFRFQLPLVVPLCDCSQSCIDVGVGSRCWRNGLRCLTWYITFADMNWVICGSLLTCQLSTKMQRARLSLNSYMASKLLARREHHSRTCGEPRLATRSQTMLVSEVPWEIGREQKAAPLWATCTYIADLRSSLHFTPPNFRRQLMGTLRKR